MTSNGVLASQRAAILANIEDDLVAIRNLATDVDEYADHPDSSAHAHNLLILLSHKTLAMLEDLGKAFDAVKESDKALDASQDRV